MNVSRPNQWLERASEDLTVARLVLGEDFTSHACFLSQQCIEKALKGYLLAKSHTYPRTHKLVDLLQVCSSIDTAFSQFETDCIRIDEYYVPTRYPDAVPGGGPEGIPSKAKSKAALNAAENILQFVKDTLA